MVDQVVPTMSWRVLSEFYLYLVRVVLFIASLTSFGTQMWGVALLMKLFNGVVDPNLSVAPNVSLSLEAAVILCVSQASDGGRMGSS